MDSGHRIISGNSIHSMICPNSDLGREVWSLRHIGSVQCKVRDYIREI